MGVRIVYKDIAPGAAESAVISAPGAHDFCAPALLPQEVEVPAYATLEPNLWLLDGTRGLMPADPVIPYWSVAMSGADCAFPAPPEIEITCPILCTSLGLWLSFSPATGDYCSAIEIRWYCGAALLDEMQFAPDAPTFFCAHAVASYDRIVLRLLSSSLPHRRARLERIVFGVIREFGPDELRRAVSDHRIDPISDAIDAATLDWQLESRDNVEYIFQSEQPVIAYDGGTLIGAYYVERAERLLNRLYDVECCDALGLLAREKFGPAIWTAQTPVSTLLATVLGSAFPYEADATLLTETLAGYIPEGTRLDALMHILFPLRAVVSTAGADKLQIFRLPNTEDTQEISSQRCMPSSLASEAPVTAVRVTAHNWSTTESGGAGSVEVGGVTYYDTQTVVEAADPTVTGSTLENIVRYEDKTMVGPAEAAAVASYALAEANRKTWSGELRGLGGERPGDAAEVPTPWGAQIVGHITKLQISLSTSSVADAELRGN